jgi:hypothetical protein
VGMVLATLVRLEMAYPGVGILAGDSLTYLTVVTAHAVVMVFFMIMPVLYGAFGNFLLPTQLGVHDVAFPRLNSAAFWFLPGGLFMLAQLVCLDRRYQRMNCFNIREVEALLKGRFFPDLVNSQDYHVLLNNSVIGLRFKTNNLNSLTHNTLLFNQYGLSTKTNKRFGSFLLENTYKVNNFEIFKPLTFYKQLITGLEYFFLNSKNIISTFFVDSHLYIVSIFSNSKPSGSIFSRNAMVFVNLPYSTVNLTKNFIERQSLIFIY